MQTFRSLRQRNYRLYFIGQMLSLIGSWTQTTALMWLAYDQTHEAKWPSFLVAAQIGPALFFGAWGGALADRLPKRRLILLTQLAFFSNALALLLCHSLDALNVWVMLVLMFFHGIVQSIDLPARMAFVSDLVPRADLSNAVALNSLLFNVARAIGPALAGLLWSYAGAWTCFVFNALSYFAIIFALLWMHLPRAAIQHHEHTIAGGFRALRQRPSLVYLVLIAGLAAVSGWPLLALLPAYVERVLHGSAENYSMLLSAVGVGALASALTAARFGTEARRKWLLWAGLALVSVSLLILVVSTHLEPALGGCALFGYGMILFFVTGQTAVQMGIDDANRGKVMGIWAMVLSAGVPCGNLVFGPAADHWGVTAVIAGQAVSMSLATVLFFWWRDQSSICSALIR